ncbi:hypothetical protein CHUAL_006568 [Chamberlinius hualienensis]
MSLTEYSKIISNLDKVHAIIQEMIDQPINEILAIATVNLFRKCPRVNLGVETPQKKNLNVKILFQERNY